MFFGNLFKKKSKSEVANDVTFSSEISAPGVELCCLSMPDDPEARKQMISKMKQDADALYDAIAQRSLLYGAIIGDIVGSKYEFNNIKSKDFPFFSDGCSFTDDTIMTIAVANALQNSWDKKEEFTSCLINGMKTLGRKYPHPQGGYGGRFAGWLESDNSQPYNSFGNGSAMRVSACAIYAVELNEALELAKLSASVTHNHTEGIKGAQAVAAAIFLAKQKKSKAGIKEYIEKNFYPLQETVEDIRKYYTFDETCQGTVPQAIIAFLESSSFEDAIRNAVSIGGDTDTIAAITGSIAWAFYLDIYADTHDEIILKANEYLPQEFIDAIILFGKKAQGRMSSYNRLTDSSGFKIYPKTRVGKDHSSTHEETKSRLEIQKWITLNLIKDNTLHYENTAEYYCIAADGSVFKKERDIFYRLILEQMVWKRDDSLVSIWDGKGPIFQEYHDFKDYFNIHNH